MSGIIWLTVILGSLAGLALVAVLAVALWLYRVLTDRDG